MQTYLSPSSKLISINSIMQTPSLLPPHHRLNFTVQSTAHRVNSAPNSVSTSLASTNNNRTDWQSSCAILASKVALQKNCTDNNHNISVVVNGHNTLDLVPIDKFLKPLTVSDLSPALNHGSTLRVAYQGVRGAYSELAAGKAYPECEAIPCDGSEIAFQYVEDWIADRAVLPVENSIGGSIHRNYDLLLRHRLHIVGELQLSFNHCLLALPDVRIEQINRVISHPQALANCEINLNKLGLNITREAVNDTAGAAEFIATNKLHDTAVIASPHAAQIYNLNILANEIQDENNNITRFMILAREPIISRTDRPFKTSIVFAQDEGPSVLFKVLSAFEFRDITLTKIECRPNRDRPIRVVDDEVAGTAKHFEYMFYVDFEASMADVRAQNALAEVQQFTSFFRVLGSYPMDIAP